MMANPHRGEVELTAGEKTLKLVFDWNAIAVLQDEFGEDETFEKLKVKTLARLLEIGCQKHHPEMTADEIMDLSPEIPAAMEAVQKALLLGWGGPDALVESEEVEETENPPKAGRAKDSDKPARRASASASRRKSSGA